MNKSKKKTILESKIQERCYPISLAFGSASPATAPKIDRSLYVFATALGLRRSSIIILMGTRSIHREERESIAKQK